jgi:2-polyprenyl-6-methoxyphenol hydroxylase-like FAD-dependent oxidoreductase
MRARVESLPSVRISDKSTVDGLDAADGRVTGVRVRGESGESGPVAADLVVDASGRGSRAPAWLRDLGYAAPEVSEVRTDVIYVTRHYRISPGQLDGVAGVAGSTWKIETIDTFARWPTGPARNLLDRCSCDLRRQDGARGRLR